MLSPRCASLVIVHYHRATSSSSLLSRTWTVMLLTFAFMRLFFSVPAARKIRSTPTKTPTIQNILSPIAKKFRSLVGPTVGTISKNLDGSIIFRLTTNDLESSTKCDLMASPDWLGTYSEALGSSFTGCEISSKNVGSVTKVAYTGRCDGFLATVTDDGKVIATVAMKVDVFGQLKTSKVFFVRIGRVADDTMLKQLSAEKTPIKTILNREDP